MRKLITKRFDPNDFPDYRKTLGKLPEYSEHLVGRTPDRGIIVLADVKNQEQADEIYHRPHIKAVEDDAEAKVPEPEVVIQTHDYLEPYEVKNVTGVGALHNQGYKGQGRKIAIIDTGISEQTKAELGSRIVGIETFVNEFPVNQGDSHGDWCLQMAAYLAPSAKYVVLKGLRYSDGIGPYSGLIQAVERAVALGCTDISMSLGGPVSTAMDASVDNADGAGRLVYVAAGNEQAGVPDARYLADETSPARASRVITVAAAHYNRTIADFSNHGTCVDASAPGVYLKAPNVSNYWSGTSMATPVVAGGVACVGSAGYTKSYIKQLVVSNLLNTAEPAYEEGQGFLNLAPIAGVYYPGVPRVTMNSYTGGGYKEECVVTHNGVEVARSVPKP